MQRKSKDQMNKNVMRKIALETIIFKKKNRYLKMDFSLILKRALLLLFIENMIYLIFQLLAVLVLPFKTFLNDCPMLLPICSSIIYLLIVMFIFIFQVRRKSLLLLILKIFEFVLFIVILGM